MTQVVPTHPSPLTALAPPPSAPSTNRKASPCRSPSSQRNLTELSEAVKDKDRRVEQRLERHGEERGRKMAAHKRKEQQRRLAAEEKRRQHKEADKERLEASVRRRGGGERGGGGEARDRRDGRPKRWTWGGPPDGAEAREFLAPPNPSDEPMSKQLSSSSSDLHSASHRDRPHPTASNRRSIAAFPDETSPAKTPTGEVPRTPVRSSSFRANGKGPATPKRMRASRSRAQSPCSPGQYPPSPIRQRAGTPGDEKKPARSEAPDKKMSKSASRELCAESPGTPTGRSPGGTTDAEEASRLLAERRRLARLQKEQEERRRQEEELLRAEEERERQREARELQERAARQAEEEKKSREEEERRQKEQRWKDMQDQLDKDREEAFQRAQKEAERKRRERERLHIQEEQERRERKKRIEEIMRRTRKSDVEAPLGAAACDGGPEMVALAPEEDVEDEEEEEEEEVVDTVDTPAPSEPPAILLGPLDNRGCVDELSDGVQSMDVSPVSRDEPASAQEFSPVADGPEGPGGPEPATRAFPKLPAGSGLGDLNENLLIQAYDGVESTALIRGQVDV
ncbi:uncharacterized protein map7d2b isoform X2 [Stigmatopora argus]